MSHYRYIQVDENGYIISDNHSSDAIEAENMIPVALDFDFTKKRWNGTGWEEYEPEPTQLDVIQAAVEKSNEELRQEGADALTMELLEGGIL